MNEVTKIHLGRQAFTVSVAAYKELRHYLDAIEKRVHDRDVVEEVEVRMAELLAEHGISGDKVILPDDVAYLKEQLGDPKDFQEGADEVEDAVNAKPAEGKRLFRDTDNAMLAGVAAGLANYLGIDALLIRILFVIGVFTGGWGILIYLLLWLLVPEAKTPSDRLQMAGRPVTIDSLKEVVGRADVKAAARRANNSLAGPVNAFFSAILKIAGVAIVVCGLAMLLGLTASAGYVLLHSGNLVQNNLFPVGLREHILLDVGLASAALIALFVVLLGVAIFRRKWPIYGWVTGVLIGLLLLSLAAGGALAADAAPQIRDRYNANRHDTVRSLPAFQNVNFLGSNDGLNVDYRSSAKYGVDLNYYGHPDLSNLKTTVTNGTLLINTQGFDPHRHCQGLCIPDMYDVTVTIEAPNPPQVSFPDLPLPAIFYKAGNQYVQPVPQQ